MLLPAALALGIAGCGASYSAGTPASAPASAAADKHAVVKTRHGKLGTFLVDGRGHNALPVPEGHEREEPLLRRLRRRVAAADHAREARGEGGAKAAKLSTSTRSGFARGRSSQRLPAVSYEPDTAAGQTRGQGVSAFGARWYVVSTAGRAITAAPTSSRPRRLSATKP